MPRAHAAAAPPPPTDPCCRLLLSVPRPHPSPTLCAAEPVLAATRKVVKPFNGLDVSPIVWVALLSFLSEILTGPQGILILIERGGM